MGKLQEIKDQVSMEKSNKEWDDLLYDMYPDDTYVNDISRYEIDMLMEEVARRYAKAVTEDTLKRAAENATLWVETPINGTEFKTVDKELGDGYDETITVFKDRILSTEINIDL